MKRLCLVGFLLVLAVIYPATAAAHHELPIEFGEALPAADYPDAGSPLDVHSDNMKLVGNFDDAGTYRQGSDLAFWGNRAVLGNYDNPGGFRLVDVSNPTNPKEIGQLECPGSQADVSIWKDLVFLSVDSPRKSSECGAGAASADQNLAGTAWEGVRIISVANPRKPRQIAAVYTDCGSHTHTLVPDHANDRVLIYVQSYPLNPQGKNCNAETHRKISVVSVPLSDPASAKVVSTPSVAPAIGCHDTTVLLPAKLAASACLTESQIWDISDPVNPKVVSHIYNPAINIHHSSTFSFDGKTAVIGDELAGATVTPGCVGGDQHLPLGALWFYDVSDPANPKEKAHYSLPQREVSAICTAHNFNTVPLSGPKDVLVSGFYNGGVTAVDFTDPTNPRQLGYYIAKGPTQSSSAPVQATVWSGYWYDGLVYGNNFDEDINSLTKKSRGLDVFQLRDPALDGAIRLGRLNPQTQEALRK